MLILCIQFTSDDLLILFNRLHQEWKPHPQTRPKPCHDWVTILLLAIIFTCFALLRSAIPFRCGPEGQDDDLTTGKPEVCVICLEDVTSEDPCRQLPCCGVVHTYCLLEKEKTYRQEKGILQFPCPKCQLQTLQTAFCPELERNTL